MSKKDPNLSRRDGQYYYRASFSLDGKVCLIPILLTYTGARREEIAKIMVDDVALIEGIWALKVRVTETGRVKTESSVRDIPLANEVIRLGFLKFVEHQREAGQVPAPSW